MHGMSWLTSVIRDVICQSFALVGASLVKIIGESPNSWPKKHI